MMYQFSHRTIADLHSIVDYIFAQGAAVPAQDVADEIERICTLIATMPHMGQRVEWIQKEQFYTFPAGRYRAYRIFYTLTPENTIIIQRIFHTHRDMETLFE